MNIREWWMPDAQQQAFRAVLDAFSRPGKHATFMDGAGEALPHLLATVLDESVTLADPDQLLDADQRRLLLAPEAGPNEARFILFDGKCAPPPGYEPPLGTLDAPEAGATLILAVGALLPGSQAQAGCMTLNLRGPGIEDQTTLHVAGLHRAWLDRRAQWVSEFPLGVDLVLCAPQRLVALPRTTRIDMEGN
ncbi:MAG: phosphonate C-P lyase system protein PhnH [Lacisediminimonas sp.]|nr:phosphonate C-P lyase system protein PhnH [Lacisediminimonas sp.]